jgi:hypothetical protein
MVSEDGLTGRGEPIHQWRTSSMDVDGTAAAPTRDAREVRGRREAVERAARSGGVHRSARDAIDPTMEMAAPEEARADRRQPFGDPHPPRTRDRRDRAIAVDLGNPRHQLARHAAASSKIRSHRLESIDKGMTARGAVT